MARILTIATTYPRWTGDSEPAFCHQLAKRMVLAGHEVFVLIPHAKGAKFKEKMDGCQIIRFPYLFPWGLEKVCYEGGALPNLRKYFWAKVGLPFLLLSEFIHIGWLIKSLKIDLIHAHWILPSGWMGAWLGKTFNIPTVISVHAGDIFPLKKGFLKKFAKSALEKASIFTVNSNATGEAVEEKLGITGGKIIPMGIDLEFFSPPAKSAKSNFTILGVGRLAEKKGFKYLMDALPNVLIEFPDTKIMLAGTGPEENNLKKHAAGLGIGEKITFLGSQSQEELQKLYQSADLFILPAIVDQHGDTEGLGVVLLEALASGLPVIASNVGGIPSIIEDGVTGILVQEKDTKALSQTIIRVIKNPQIVKTMALKGRNKVQQEFSWKIISKKFFNLYANLLNDEKL